MKVHFLVPGTGELPNGGIRVIYEHANRLAQRGHEIVLHHLLQFPRDKWRFLFRHGWAYARQRTASPGFPHWFTFAAGVERRYTLFARPPQTERGDKIVATYWKTHELFTAESLEMGDHYYLIQGLETWLASEDRLYAQWRSPSTNIVVSRWLQRVVEQVSGQAQLIPNAIDQDYFCEMGDKERSPATILFCSMSSPNKASRDIAVALNHLHEAGERYTILTFGNVHPAEFGLVAPCEHHQSPPQAVIRTLYNRASIFVAASRSEGWGLTLAEATACGAALIVSDAEGHFEFARPGKSAMFFRRGGSGRLAQKIRFLAQRPSLQQRLVRNAQVDLAPYNWDDASRQLEAVLAGTPSDFTP